MEERNHKEKKEDTKMLQVATREEMTMIREKLKRYLPHSAIAYGVLQSHLLYEGLSAIRRCTVLHAEDTSLVILILKNPKGGLQILTPFWDAEEEDEREITRLFSTMPEFKWSEPFLCNPSPLELVYKQEPSDRCSHLQLHLDDLWPRCRHKMSQVELEVEAMITSGQVGNGDLIPSRPIEIALVYGLTSALREQPSLPEGFEMRTIKESDAKHFHDHWKYKFSMSLESYKVLLKEVPGFAIVRSKEGLSESHTKMETGENADTALEKSSVQRDVAVRPISHTEHEETGSAESAGGSANHQNPGKTSHQKDLADEADRDGDHRFSDPVLPVAWSHLSMNHSISNTFTLPPFRRKGLSKAVTVALTELLIRQTGVAYAFIDEDNVGSIKLHEQLGFTKLSMTGWQYYRKRSYK